MPFEIIGIVLTFCAVLFIWWLFYTIVPTLKQRKKHRIKKDNRVRSEEMTLYLTFDDGPSEKYTPMILDLLKNEGVTASFFVVGDFAAANSEIMKRMKEEGHLIGLHSQKHVCSMFQGCCKTKNDMGNCIAQLNAFGIEPKHYRPPWGQFNIFTEKTAQNNNLNIVLWDVMAEDWQATISSEEIFNRLMKRVEDGSIICLHDGRGRKGAPERTLQALSKAIPIWKEDGYKFETVEKLDIEIS